MNEEVAEANENAAQRMADYKREARETAARIANDEQAIMALVEETMLAWAKDGLLNVEDHQMVFDHSVKRWVRQTLPDRSALVAASFIASAVKDVLDDALSADAKEAIEGVRS